MSIITTEQAQVEQPHGAQAEQPTAQAEQPTQEAPAQETDWKAEARKWESRAKQNAEAAKRLAEIEEASKTEAQKQAERLAELEAKVAEYEQREQIAAWKAQVSEETGVPAEALRGSSLEEIQEHAQTLKSLIPAPAEPTTTPTPPVGTTPPTPSGNVSIDAQIAAAEAAGDRALVAALKAMKLAAAAGN